MGKPTSVAALVARQAAEKRLAAAKQDEQLSRKKAPAGKVWVRLIRPHYDAEGVHWKIGPALLNEDAIPSSAKILTVQASPASPPEDSEGDDE